MAKRKRDMQLNFRVSAEKLAVIEQKMSQFGTSNREAYLRKSGGRCGEETPFLPPQMEYLSLL